MADIKSIAGRAKDILVGNNVKQGKQNILNKEQLLKNTLRVNKPNIKRMNRKLNVATSLEDSVGIDKAKKSLELLNQANKDALNAYGDAKRNLVKERAKTYSARAGVGALAVTPGAVGYGIYKNKKEKTAYDIVVDAFEKIAIEEEKPISTVGGTVKGSLVGGGLGTLAGGLAGAKAGAELIGGKGGAVKGALAGAAYGAATGGTFGGSIGHAVSKARARDQQNRYLSEIIAQSKKNQEKTAYDIVVDAFEKMAEEDKKKKQKPILLSDGAIKGALAGALASGAFLATGSKPKPTAKEIAQGFAIGAPVGILPGALVGTGINAIRRSDRRAKERFERENR